MAHAVLIEIITIMVLISIRPFAFRKVFLLAATLFCLSSAMCIADSLFMSLHAGRHPGQVSWVQEVAVAPSGHPHPTPRIVSLGSFASGLGRIFSESLVPSLTAAGAPDALGGIDDPACRPLWLESANSK